MRREVEGEGKQRHSRTEIEGESRGMNKRVFDGF